MIKVSIYFSSNHTETKNAWKETPRFLVYMERKKEKKQDEEKKKFREE